MPKHRYAGEEIETLQRHEARKMLWREVCKRLPKPSRQIPLNREAIRDLTPMMDSQYGKDWIKEQLDSEIQYPLDHPYNPTRQKGAEFRQ